MSEFTHRLPHQPLSKPSRNEDHYFRREDFRKRMTAARHREARRKLEERTRWLEEHQGHCPQCGGVLGAMTTADGSAEQCPNCLGVWMDQETFDHLTHPHQKNQYFTEILREMVLEWTTGATKVDRPGKE